MTKMMESRGRNGLFVKFIFLCGWILLLNSKYLYKHLRKRGVLVVVWVLNDDEEF